MSKKVVISGYYGADNFGDESILEVLIQRLKKDEADITVLSTNPEKTAETHGVNSVHSFKLGKVMNALSKCDILVSGGGSLLQDATSLKSLFYYLWVIFMAQFYKKQVLIFAQGIGPINNKVGEFFTKKLLKNCRWISVRDDKSLFLCAFPQRRWHSLSEEHCRDYYGAVAEVRSSEHPGDPGVLWLYHLSEGLFLPDRL